MRPFTVPQAARELGISEYEVEKYIKKSRLEVVRRRAYGGGRARLLSYDDVMDLRRQLVVHHSQRLIATIGVSDTVDAALEISGLKVVPCSDVMDAVSAHPRGIRPVIVMTLEAIEKNTDQRGVFGENIDVIAHQDDDKLRDLVQWCWRYAEKRSSPS